MFSLGADSPAVPDEASDFHFSSLFDSPPASPTAGKSSQNKIEETRQQWIYLDKLGFGTRATPKTPEKQENPVETGKIPENPEIPTNPMETIQFPWGRGFSSSSQPLQEILIRLTCFYDFSRDFRGPEDFQTPREKKEGKKKNEKKQGNSGKGRGGGLFGSSSASFRPPTSIRSAGLPRVSDPGGRNPQLESFLLDAILGGQPSSSNLESVLSDGSASEADIDSLLKREVAKLESAMEDALGNLGNEWAAEIPSNSEDLQEALQRPITPAAIAAAVASISAAVAAEPASSSSASPTSAVAPAAEPEKSSSPANPNEPPSAPQLIKQSSSTSSSSSNSSHPPQFHQFPVSLHSTISTGIIHEIQSFYHSYEYSIQPEEIRLIHRGREISFPPEKKGKSSSSSSSSSSLKDFSHRFLPEILNLQLIPGDLEDPRPVCEFFLVLDRLSRFSFDSLTAPSGFSVSPDKKTVKVVTNSSESSKWGSLRAEFPIVRGKYYWIYHFTQLSNGNAFCGCISTKEFINSTYLGNNHQSYGYFGCGNSYKNGSNMNYGKAYSQGDSIECRVDMEKRTMEFLLNGNELGICFQDLPGEIYPAVSLYTTGDSVTITEFGTW